MTARGRTARGRSRALREPILSPTKHLFERRDHGEPIAIRAHHLGLRTDDWVEPFLAANTPTFRRLDVNPEIRTERGLHLVLHPNARVGAAPLLAPATRKVAAGLLIAPRFSWPSLGVVFARIGFSVEPAIGAGPLVPGSARAVPPWLIAGPVLRRIEAMIRHARRSFVEIHEERTSPRGRIEWSQFARGAFARGQWTRLPCVFSEPAPDPALFASARWTVRRVLDALTTVAGSRVGQALVERGRTLDAALGPGPLARPSFELGSGLETSWIRDAVEAMGWVSDERGLGGARSLDGLAWDLAIDAVWEAWVRTFVHEVGLRLGLRSIPNDSLRHRLRWSGRIDGLSSLVPDCVVGDERRVVIVDAKYKAHFQLIARAGLRQQSAALRDAHRADIHQALAYAALFDATQTDIVLCYPQLGERRQPPSAATVSNGERRVRVWLAELPFGFESGAEHDDAVRAWSLMLPLT